MAKADKLQEGYRRVWYSQVELSIMNRREDLALTMKTFDRGKDKERVVSVLVQNVAWDRGH